MYDNERLLRNSTCNIPFEEEHVNRLAVLAVVGIGTTPPVAKLLVPAWGDTVDSGSGCPMPESTIFPSRGL
jgi:hypothetical protein